MSIKVTNNSWGILSIGINETDTTILLETAQGDRFPSLPPSVAGENDDYFYVTLVSPENVLEIVRVIDRVNDVLTVVRGQDGTRAKAFLAGARVELRPVAALFNAKKDILEDEKEKEEINDRIDELEDYVKTELEDVIHTGKQDLTDEEMDQARDNIGAMGIDNDEEVTGSKTFSAPTFFKNNITLMQRSEVDPRSFCLFGRMADNDAWVIRGGAESLKTGKDNTETEKDNGYLEIATADNGNEPIYFSQYNNSNVPFADDKNQESWDDCFINLVRRVTLLDREGNSSFPGKVTAGGAVFGSYFQATSDKRLKTEFQSISNPTEILKGITGLSYRRLDRDHHKRFVGVVAQDVQKVLPEAVEQSGLGYLSVDYNAIVGVLVEEVKALRKELEEIKNGMQEKVQDPVEKTVQEVKKAVSRRRAVK